MGDALKQQARKHQEHHWVSRKVSVEEITGVLSSGFVTRTCHITVKTIGYCAWLRSGIVDMGRTTGASSDNGGRGVEFTRAAVSIMIGKLRGQKFSAEHTAFIESVLCEIEDTENSQNDSKKGVFEIDDADKKDAQVFIHRRKRKP